MRTCGLFAALMCVVASAQAATPMLAEYVHVRDGDDPAWSTPSFDDRDWQKIHWTAIDPQLRILWVRVRVTLPADAVRAATDSSGALLRVSVPASYQAYWNGVPVAANGVPAATADGETPGLLDSRIVIPSRLLRAGDNVLALRMSAFHARRQFAMPMQRLLFEIAPLPVHGVPLARLPVIAASGALLFGALYFGAMFASDRRDRASLLLALLSLSVLGQLCAEFARLVPYEYPLHVLRLESILGFAALSGILLVLYVLRRFPWRAGPRVVAVVVVLMTVGVGLTPGFDGKTAVAILVPLLGALSVAIRAAMARVPRALGLGLAVGLVLASFAVAPHRFADETQYLAASAFLLFLFAQQVMELRRVQQERESTRSRSVRLELELLKRQIQPHFLMNTLTALSELIESDPPTGVRMINALAAELRTLAVVSGQSTVPMSTEMELCRAHLQVMSLRREQVFELSEQGIDPKAPVPPGTFHTLIENALTHNDYPRGARFVLEQTAGPTGARIYRLRSPRQGSKSTRADGQGHAYVRARLREAFGDAGHFAAGPAAEEWQAVVEMPARA